MRANRFMTALALCGALLLAACGGESSSGGGGGGGQQDLAQLSGDVRVDGSSTVQPFAQAAAELFGEEAGDVRVTVGGAGTGDGFERFCRGEIPIADASRPIEDDERQACREEGIRPVEIQVANDGLAVVANPDLQIPNNCITTQQLKRLLAPDSNVQNLSELGEGFPDQPVQFFTPGEESGTFDFFTERVLETDAEQRTDGVQTSANDNQLVQGVSGTPGAIGYFGFSFANENKESLNILQVDDGEGCMAPSVETIQSGAYPLSRPIFMYPSRQALQRPEVRAFMEFVLENQQRIAEAVEIVPMTQEQVAESRQKLDQAVQGGAGAASTTEGR